MICWYDQIPVPENIRLKMCKYMLWSEILIESAVGMKSSPFIQQKSLIQQELISYHH